MLDMSISRYENNKNSKYQNIIELITEVHEDGTVKLKKEREEEE